MDLRQVVNRIAKLIEDRQQKLAPYKTGALKRSIKTFVTYGRNLITISSQMKDYGYFQDSGVSGTVKKVTVKTDKKIKIFLLYDTNRNLVKRIKLEQLRKNKI